MTNIWSFIMQTLEVSLAAILILFVRLLLKSCVPPIWRYTLWFILAVRILSPAGILCRYLIPSLDVALETIKTLAETSLNSSYISKYEPIRVLFPIPWINNSPSSFTDWFFILYILTAVIFLVIYIISSIKKAKSITSTRSRIIYIIQAFFWSSLRSLNWCNPFLQYVFSIVAKDMHCLYDYNENNKRDNPPGIQLLWVIIFILLLVPSAIGISSPGLYAIKSGKWSLQQAYASARISRCTTVAGALDTYAKAIMHYNTVYMSAVTPIAKQEEIINSSTELFKDYIPYSNGDYDIYNLAKEDNTTYSAIIAVPCDKLLKESGEFYTYKDSSGNVRNSKGYYLYPVTLKKSYGWVISDTGKSQIVINGDCDSTEGYSLQIPFLNTYEAKCNTGVITIGERSIYKIDNVIKDNNTLFLGIPVNNYNKTAKQDAQFDYASIDITVTYKYTGTDEQKKFLNSAGFAVLSIYNGQDTPEFQDDKMAGDISGAGGEYNFTNRSTPQNWDGIVSNSFGTSRDIKTEGLFPDSYKVRIYWNRKPIDTVDVMRGDNK